MQRPRSPSQDLGRRRPPAEKNWMHVSRRSIGAARGGSEDLNHEETVNTRRRNAIMASEINRRRFNNLLTSGLAVAASSGLALRRAGAATSDITVLNWKGYGTDEAWALKGFAAASGIEVKHDYFNSEPEMPTKLQTNPGAYDV